jgi:hypothetical protein
LPLWLAYLLGLLSWVPLAAAAVLTGRFLAAVPESQTPPISQIPSKHHDSAGRRGAGWRQEFFDDWSFAWDDLS